MKNDLIILKNGKMTITSLELVELRDYKPNDGMGVCYILDFGGDVLKIGKSKQPYRRIKNILNLSPKQPEGIYISSPCINYSQLETYLHRSYKSNQINGEYFCVKLSNVIRTIENFSPIIEKKRKLSAPELLEQHVDITEKILARNGVSNPRQLAIELIVTNCEDFGIFLEQEELTEEELLAMV